MSKREWLETVGDEESKMKKGGGLIFIGIGQPNISEGQDQWHQEHCARGEGGAIEQCDSQW